MSVLEARNVTKKFNEIVALKGLSLNVDRGVILGIVGPNGSGKTTFVNLVTGFTGVNDGQLLFNGLRIDGRRAHEIARLGIGRTFQETRVFRKMSVMENVLVASPSGINPGSFAKARNLLKFVGLPDMETQYSGNLSYGQQKLVEFARILMRDPELILFDEPTAGVNPVLAEDLLKRLKTLRERGKTIIMVEHNMHAISAVCEKVVVLHHGEKIAEGTPAEIQNNEAVQDAYLRSA